MIQKLAAVLMIFCGLVFAGNAMAAIYTWVDERGVTHISDAPVVQGNENVKIEKRIGDDSGSSKKKSDEWFNCSTSYERGLEAAREFLKAQEGWSNVPAKPTANPDYRAPGTYKDSRGSVYHYGFDLPGHVIAAAGRSWGCQEVMVISGQNAQDVNLCHIVAVEPTKKVFGPALLNQSGQKKP